MYLRNYFAKIACRYYYVSFLPKWKSMWKKKKIKIVIVKNNIAIHIAGKVSRYIDASMNRATPTCYTTVTAITAMIAMLHNCYSQYRCHDSHVTQLLQCISRHLEASDTLVTVSPLQMSHLAWNKGHHNVPPCVMPIIATPSPVEAVNSSDRITNKRHRAFILAR